MLVWVRLTAGCIGRENRLASTRNTEFEFEFEGEYIKTQQTGTGCPNIRNVHISRTLTIILSPDQQELSYRSPWYFRATK